MAEALAIGPPRQHRRSNLLEIAALLALGLGGSAFMLFVPAVTQAIERLLSLTPAQSTLVATIEMSGTATSAFIVAFFWRRVGAGPLVVGGAIGLILANIAAGFATTPSNLYVARALCGIFEGTIIAMMSALLALRSDGARIFAFSLSLNMLVSAVGFQFIPRILAAWGISGLFGGMACLAIPVLLLSPWLSRQRNIRETGYEPAAVANDGKWAVAVALVGAVCLFAAISAAWTVMARAGLEQGHSDAEIAAGLSIATIMGIAAGVAAGWLDQRFSNRSLLLTATFILAGAIISFPALGGEAPFSFKATALLSGYILAAPFYLGAIAGLDRSGRLAAFFIPIQYVGLAIGPALAAPLLARGTAPIFILSASLCCLAALLVTSAEAWSKRTPRI